MRLYSHFANHIAKKWMHKQNFLLGSNRRDSSDGYGVIGRRINITGNQERHAPMKHSLIALVLVSFLSACGGGGGGSSPADPPGSGGGGSGSGGGSGGGGSTGPTEPTAEEYRDAALILDIGTFGAATAMLNPWQRVALMPGLMSSSPCPSACTNPLFAAMAHSTALTIKTVRFP